MLDFSHIPTRYGAATVEYFEGVAPSAAAASMTWLKPRGKSMCNMLLVGCGGNGGNGVIGANSTAAGGGGGASGPQVSLTFPLWAVPDILFLNLTAGGSGGVSSVSIVQNGASQNVLALVNAGGNGGNASGATAGTAGAAPSGSTAANMPLGWGWADNVISGQAGIAGGTTGAGAALTLPVTGLLVTGGTGGAGLGAAGAVGTAGGAFTVTTGFPPQIGGAGGSAATTPPNNGSNGLRPIPGLMYGYGGTGGGSTHGTATGAGLVASRGGAGAPGCGGGGGGGALTGSTAGSGGLGGPAFCVITCW